jgi:hypothetical protein
MDNSMTLYARSDVASVTVSRSHHGCGETHRRPLQNGSPVRLWALTCVPCETHLTHDPLWAGTVPDVPDTPDETRAQENSQRTSVKSREDLMALAMAKIAGLPVSEFLGEMIGASANRGTVNCASGHENFPNAKFCAECGSKLGGNDEVKTGVALPPGAYRSDDAQDVASQPDGAAPPEKPARQPRQPKAAETGRTGRYAAPAPTPAPARSQAPRSLEEELASAPSI